MERIRMFVAAAGALVVSGALAASPARAEVQNGAGALRAAAENGAQVEQVDFRGLCWRFGWRGPGWYPCGYFDRDEFREHEHREHELREFREHREHEFREHEHREHEFRRY